MSAGSLQPVGHFIDGLLSEIADQIAKDETISDFWPAHGKASFDQIKALYRTIDLNHYTPYPVDWTQQFSPIERMTWSEIRYRGLPFWPQFPIGKYFADFADPKLKIVIECDGKDFHDKERDEIRDRWMTHQGWAVFRISGSDCNRLMGSPWEAISEGDVERESEQYQRLVREWHIRTVDGLISAIASYYYGSRAPDEHVRAALISRLCGYAGGLFRGAR